jgi:hypothetical protein
MTISAVLGSERLNAEQVRRFVKAQAGKLGLDPKQFGAHSLRKWTVVLCSRERCQHYQAETAFEAPQHGCANQQSPSSGFFRDHCLSGLV